MLIFYIYFTLLLTWLRIYTTWGSHSELTGQQQAMRDGLRNRRSSVSALTNRTYIYNQCRKRQKGRNDFSGCQRGGGGDTEPLFQQCIQQETAPMSTVWTYCIRECLHCISVNVLGFRKCQLCHAGRVTNHHNNLSCSGERELLSSMHFHNSIQN